MSVKLIGGAVILGCALLSDAPQSIKLCTTTITIFGVKFLAEKLTATMNKNQSQIINLAGWSLMAIPLVGLIKLSMGGVHEVSSSVDKIKGEFTSIGTWIGNIAENVNPLHWFN